MKHCKTCDGYINDPGDIEQSSNDGFYHRSCRPKLDVNSRKYCASCKAFIHEELMLCPTCEGEGTEKLYGICNTEGCGYEATVDSNDEECPNCGLLEDVPGKSCNKCHKIYYPSEVTICCGELKSTSILITQYESSPHDVKGTKRNGKYSVRVWVDRVKWQIPDEMSREFERPYYVEAKIKRTKVPKPRKNPPFPLSAIDVNGLSTIEESIDETASTEEVENLSENDLATGAEAEGVEAVVKEEEDNYKLGDLQDFDKGHLVALFLGGVDNSWQIIPQVRACNRGTWQAMEREVFEMAKNKTTIAPVVLGDGNTIGDKSLKMSIYIHYADQRGKYDVGDPRIPVFFYVQLHLKKKGVAHYLIANKLRESTPLPTDNEINLFKFAHKNLGMDIPNFSDKGLIKAWQDKRDEYYVKDPDPKALPSREKRVEKSAEKGETIKKVKFEFEVNSDEDVIHEMNAYKNDKIKKSKEEEDDSHSKYNEKLKATFNTTEGPYRALQWLWNQGLINDPVSFDEKAFQKEQIAWIRKYNMWLNGGRMLSDARDEKTSDKWNKGEKSDPFPELDEASGQAYPEVDHILPKKKQGTSSYANARLVSFSLNHIYREKPDEPKKIDIPKYADAKITEKGFRVSVSDSHIRDKIKRRQEYLRKMHKLHNLCDGKRKWSDKFAHVRKLHSEGCEHYNDNPSLELKELMKEFGDALHPTRHGTKHFKIADISDEIKKFKS